MTNAVAYCATVRGALFANNNLLENIPKRMALLAAAPPNHRAAGSARRHESVVLFKPAGVLADFLVWPG